MEILEQSVIGKHQDPLLCEDGIFIGDDFVAVVDGVTSKGELLKNGQTSGYAAKELILQAFRSVSPQVDALQCLSFLDKCLNKGSELLCKSLKHENLMRAAVVIYSRSHNCIWMYGDCMFAVDGVVHKNGKLIDDLASEIRSMLLEDRLKNGASIRELLAHDSARDDILSLLRQEQLFENKKGRFGYGVLNGCGIEAEHIVSYPIPAGTHEIVLASDGYPELFMTLNETESYLSELLRQDPLCYSVYKSTKGLSPDKISFDDRAYCKFIIS